MKPSTTHISKLALSAFRIALFFMAFYFFAMGLALILFPQFLTRMVGGEHGTILGMLRGSGGSIIPYSFMYILVAIKPLEGRWLAFIIVCANVLAIILDFTSVFLKEYQISHAMIDAPFELLSLFVLAKFYSSPGVKLLIKNGSMKI
jgi:hypothetical protein